ncbi:MAG: ABC transporter permease [Chloroflexota bacterium]
MITYIVRRVLLSIPLLWGVLTIVFLGFHALPGDPAAQMLFGHGTAADVARLRHEMGLDRPLVVQYWDFISHAARLDFGTSLTSQQPVFTEIWDRFPLTLQLVVCAMIPSVVIGLSLGVLAAVNDRTIVGSSVTTFMLILLSLPDFWLGTMLALIFGVQLHWLPVAGTGDFRNIILPAATLGSGITAVLMRLTRVALIDVLGMQYIRTARAKGVIERRVLFQHALRNALIPLVTVVGLIFTSLLGGVVIIETVFAWPGVGTLAFNAVLQRDFPMIQGTTFFFALLLIGGNLLVDITYAFFDPRIQYA